MYQLYHITVFPDRNKINAKKDGAEIIFSQMFNYLKSKLAYKSFNSMTGGI